MTFHYDVTGPRRKALVNAMSEILECNAKYLGMPSAAYQVHYFTVSKNGGVTFDDRADSEEIENLYNALKERGFEPTPLAQFVEDTAESEQESTHATTESDSSSDTDEVGLSVAMPIDKVNVANLTHLLEVRGGLIRKALGVDALPVEVRESQVVFPWFPTMPVDADSQAYTQLITALCRMSVEQQRINNPSKRTENEKYTFRCLLLRLGFIGQEYKAYRKILLRNFSGGSAFRNQEEADKHKAKQLAKRKELKALAGGGGLDYAVSK